MIKTDNNKDLAIGVALISNRQSEEQTKEYLDELIFLSETLGIKILSTFTQKLDTPDVRSFVGKGKLEEIKTYVKAMDVNSVIFDDDLSPSQLRNIEKSLSVTIYDRSLLILEIFLKRAKTAQARTQVELARSQYLMPRLTRLWTHLERQRGGTGTRGGAGEKEIETDRRMLRDKISLLKKKLEKIDKQNATQRKNRSQITRVALVGYTNVGKSTIMSMMSKSDVFSENKLFATVDATVRKVVIDQIPFLLSDTVGFIRKLPHTLVESFKSTLDEIREADVLIHVIDVSHEGFEEQIDIVNQTLKEIDASGKPIILAFNKSDLFLRKKPNDEEEWDVQNNQEKLDNIIKSYSVNEKFSAVSISAKKKLNFDELRNQVIKLVKERHYTIYPNFLKKNEY